MKPTDRRLVLVARTMKRLFRGQPFLILVADFDQSVPIASLSNLPTEGQVMLLEAVLRSFHRGTASPMQPVPMDEKR